jgi:AraC-like DNA-binding protein
MRLGGTIKRGQQTVEARLLLAYTGGTRFVLTRWKHCRHRWWVLDYINQGQQQRVGRGKAFTRINGVAALYAPGRDYWERQIAGGSVDESYIIFDARGAAEAWLRQLTGVKGWCHFRDHDHLIGASLRQAAELVFYRRPGFHLLAHGALMELLGLLVTASPLAPNLRDVRPESGAARRDDLISAVERFISDHIAEPVRVADLARHAKMSVSAFAHAYPRLAGESPYHTVRRLKLEAAKRFLLQDGLSVKECAERLGFSSEFHFSRLFKRLEGMSPTHYRHALTEKALGGPPPPRKLNRP